MFRNIQRLRKKVRNRARVEGSIAEAYLVEETTNFLAMYFKNDVHSIRNRPPRYDDGMLTFRAACDLEMFQHPGRCMSSRGYRDLTEEEYNAAFMYILTNLSEMDVFFEYVFSSHSLIVVFLYKLEISEVTISCSKFDQEQWKGIAAPNEHQIIDLRLNGWKGRHGIDNGPNFFDWFKSLVMTWNTDFF